MLCRENSRGQFGRGPKGCAKEGDRDGRAVGDGKREPAGLGGRGLVRERRDPHSTGMDVGMHSRCGGSRDFPPTSQLQCSKFIFSGSAGNRESYGQGVQCPSHLVACP